MLRRLWQSGMIAMARSGTMTRFMQGNRAASFLAGKYVAGSEPVQALKKADELYAQSGIRSSLFYLGEYVDTPELVQLNFENKLAIADELKHSTLDVHISVDPSQIGYSIDSSKAHDYVLQIAEAVNSASSGRDGVHCIMLDMEDNSFVDLTIGLHNDLKQKGYKTALTLQAYLKRTVTDLKAQIESGSRVRLVKGAFVADSDIAFTTQKEIKDNYYELVTLMLSSHSREKGFYPIIATHDDRIHEFAISAAKKNGWKPGEYEFEMLLGVRSNIAKELSSRGERVRLYLPFGKDWWPYAIRRIGENPKNGVLLLRSLFN